MPVDSPPDGGAGGQEVPVAEPGEGPVGDPVGDPVGNPNEPVDSPPDSGAGGQEVPVGGPGQGIVIESPPAATPTVQQPATGAAISRNPGLVCPRCSHKILVTIEQLLGGHGLQCPNCQLKLGVPRQENRDVLNALGKVQKAMDEAKESTQRYSRGGSRQRPKRRAVRGRAVKPRRA